MTPIQICRGAVVVAVIVMSGLASACTSNRPRAPVSLPVPTTGEITFYLSLPGSTAGLGDAVAKAATPGSSTYRHFSSLDRIAQQFGASDAQINTVAKSIKTLGLQFVAGPTRLFGRVTGSTGQWQAALGTALSRQVATASNPFITYTPAQAAARGAATRAGLNHPARPGPFRSGESASRQAQIRGAGAAASSLRTVGRPLLRACRGGGLDLAVAAAVRGWLEQVAAASAGDLDDVCVIVATIVAAGSRDSAHAMDRGSSVSRDEVRLTSRGRDLGRADVFSL